jgi:hypothetical protein
MCLSAMVGISATSDELSDALQVFERVDSARVSLEVRDEPLSEVMEELAAQIPASLRADWSSLERLGVRPDSPVTIRITHSHGLTALAAVAISLGDEFERPVFEAGGAGMVFTTLNGAATMRCTGVYDVRDLLADSTLIPRLRDAAPMMRDANSDRAADPPAGSDHDDHKLGGDAGSGEDAQPHVVRELTPGEQLIMLVTDHIDPEAWIHVGGSRARITERNGLIVLTAGPTVHRKLRLALEKLREANPGSMTIDATIIELPRASYDRLSRVSGPGSVATVMSLKSSGDAVVLWRATEPVAMGATLQTESSSDGTIIRVNLRPTYDDATGSVKIGIDVATDASGNRRSVQTEILLAGGAGATVVELPAVGSPETCQLLLLILQ